MKGEKFRSRYCKVRQLQRCGQPSHGRHGGVLSGRAATGSCLDRLDTPEMIHLAPARDVSQQTNEVNRVVGTEGMLKTKNGDKNVKSKKASGNAGSGKQTKGMYEVPIEMVLDLNNFLNLLREFLCITRYGYL